LIEVGFDPQVIFVYARIRTDLISMGSGTETVDLVVLDIGLVVEVVAGPGRALARVLGRWSIR
jgi:hypothetical protein